MFPRPPIALGAALLAAAPAASQADLVPVDHRQFGAERAFAVVASAGSLDDLARPADDRYLVSSWIDSGYETTLEETFVFAGGPAPQGSSPLVEYQIVALLYMDGGDNQTLRAPVPPPRPSSSAYDDSADWRFLKEARFLVEDSGYWFPALHDLPAVAKVDLGDIIYSGYPTDGRYWWDRPAGTLTYGEGRTWAREWSPALASHHPGPIRVHGFASRALIREPNPGQREVRVKFRTRGIVPSGNFDITHRWDALQLFVDFRDGVGPRPWGQVVEYHPREIVDPRAAMTSRFRTVLPAIGDPTDLWTIDGRCLATCWLDSLPVPNQSGFEVWDQFDYDLSAYGISSGDQLDSLAFRALVYLHGGQGSEPSRPIAPPWVATASEHESIDAARIEIYDWYGGTWVPFPLSWLDANRYAPGTGTLWRGTPPHPYALEWSRPAEAGVHTYPGGIDLKVRTGPAFPMRAGFVASNGRTRLRVLTVFHEIHDWLGLWDLSYAWDTALLSASFGRGCALPSGGAPDLFSNGFAVGGLPFNLFVNSAPPNSAGVLLLGLSRTSWNGLPLPLPLDALGLPGCTLYTTPEVQLPAQVDARGWAIWSLAALPGGPAMRAMPFYAQFLGVRSAPPGFLSSNAYGIQIR